jgi:hypothetical protein
MRILPRINERKPAKAYSVVAVAAVCLAVACGTGVAAFAGLLPASKGVAVAMTATPLIDMQINASVNRSRDLGSPAGRRALRREAA